MQKTQRTFTKEFKVEAVKLLQSSQKPLAQVARDLGQERDILKKSPGIFSRSQL